MPLPSVTGEVWWSLNLSPKDRPSKEETLTYTRSQVIIMRYVG